MHSCSASVFGAGKKSRIISRLTTIGKTKVDASGINSLGLKEERREKKTSLLGEHNSALCPNAERGRERKIQCNILFGINSLSLLQEHLI